MYGVPIFRSYLIFYLHTTVTKPFMLKIRKPVYTQGFFFCQTVAGTRKPAWRQGFLGTVHQGEDLGARSRDTNPFSPLSFYRVCNHRQVHFPALVFPSVK